MCEKKFTNLTGIFAAGRTPIELAPVLRLRALLLLPSTFPNDSGKPNSSPTLKPITIGSLRATKKKVNAEEEEKLEHHILFK